MNYRIQRADTPVAVLPLDEVCFPGDHRPTMENSLWWVVWRGKEPVAYAGLRVCQWHENKGLAFLSRAGVLAEHRGRGLQKRLIRVREAQCKTLGLKQIITYVAHWNCPSLNSLIACGYRFYRPADKWAGSDSVYLHKVL